MKSEMKEKHINGFDYLKVFAASAIVLHHYQQVFSVCFQGINFYGGRINFGYLVELFFTISGFLMVYCDNRRTNSRVVSAGGGTSAEMAEIMAYGSMLYYGLPSPEIV